MQIKQANDTKSSKIKTFISQTWSDSAAALFKKIPNIRNNRKNQIQMTNLQIRIDYSF